MFLTATSVVERCYTPIIDIDALMTATVRYTLRVELCDCVVRYRLPYMRDMTCSLLDLAATHAILRRARDSH